MSWLKTTNKTCTYCKSSTFVCLAYFLFHVSFLLTFQYLAKNSTITKCCIHNLSHNLIKDRNEKETNGHKNEGFIFDLGFLFSVHVKRRIIYRNNIPNLRTL